MPCSWKSSSPSASPVKMLVSMPVSAAELDSCPSDTFILLQGFPTSASTENAWARELRPCILAKCPVFLRVVYPSELWLCPAQNSVSQLIQGKTGQTRQQQQQHLREPLFSHGGSVTLRNWSGAFPCVLQDVRPHPKSWLLARLSTSLQYFPLSPFIRFCVFPLLSVSQRACSSGPPLRVTEREGIAQQAFLHIGLRCKKYLFILMPAFNPSFLRQTRNLCYSKGDIKCFFFSEAITFPPFGNVTTLYPCKIWQINSSVSSSTGVIWFQIDFSLFSGKQVRWANRRSYKTNETQ